jgi:hypothetical protein
MENMSSDEEMKKLSDEIETAIEIEKEIQTEKNRQFNHQVAITSATSFCFYCNSYC